MPIASARSGSFRNTCQWRNLDFFTFSENIYHFSSFAFQSWSFYHKYACTNLLSVWRWIFSKNFNYILFYFLKHDLKQKDLFNGEDDCCQAFDLKVLNLFSIMYSSAFVLYFILFFRQNNFFLALLYSLVFLLIFTYHSLSWDEYISSSFLSRINNPWLLTWDVFSNIFCCSLAAALESTVRDNHNQTHRTHPDEWIHYNNVVFFFFFILLSTKLCI